MYMYNTHTHTHTHTLSSCHIFYHTSRSISCVTRHAWLQLTPFLGRRADEGAHLSRKLRGLAQQWQRIFRLCVFEQNSASSPVRLGIGRVHVEHLCMTETDAGRRVWGLHVPAKDPACARTFSNIFSAASKLLPCRNFSACLRRPSACAIPRPCGLAPGTNSSSRMAARRGVHSSVLRTCVAAPLPIIAA